jgi:hypothetical protein
MTLEIQVLANDRGAKICSEKNFTAKTVEILEKSNIDIQKTQIHAGSLSWVHVYFVNIGGIDAHHCLNFIFI